jgi:sec-independent protein translocase protein TatA
MAFVAAPSPIEMLVVLGIALIVLGPKRLPEAARSVGRGIRELKESLQSGPDAYDDDEDEEDDSPDQAEKRAS